MQSGVVFSEFAVALPASVSVYQANSGKSEAMTATELVHRAHHLNQFTLPQSFAAGSTLQKLNTAGQWQTVESESNSKSNFLKPGALFRG